MSIEELLTHQACAILDQSMAAVRRSHLPHYEGIGEEALRLRLQVLLELTDQAVRERNVGPLLGHIEVIARERFETGTGLGEVQTALNVLEEAIWERAAVSVPPEDLAVALGLVSTALGEAKDCLARTYVSLASRGHAPSIDEQALFGGL